MKALIHERLHRFGVTGAGRDWLLRALHPASEDRSPGLPDQSAMSVLRPDFRIQATIQSPPSVGSWDCLVWTPPGDVNAVFWATGPAGTDFGAVSAPSSSCEVGALRLQRSTQSTVPTTFQQNSDPTAFGEFRCLTSTGAITNAGFRHQFKSITIHQIASAVSDQGQVYAAQFPPNFTTPGLMIPVGYDSGVVDPAPPDPQRPNYQLYGELYQTVLPSNEGDMAAMAPDFYMGPSREGVYLPLRLSGPSQPFSRAKPHANAYLAARGQTAYGADTSVFSNGALIQPTANVVEGTANAYPWPFRAAMVSGVLGSPPGSVLQVPGGLLLDSGYDNMNIGVVIFRGLQGGGGGGFSSALQLKCVAGLEIAPNPGASDRVFAEAAASYDPKALQAYYSLAMELKGCYPASYNSWGDIWDAIKSAASSVWGVVKPIATGFVEKAAPMLIDAGMGAMSRGLGGVALTGASRGRSASRTAPRLTYREPSTARSTSTRRVSLARPSKGRGKLKTRR